MRKFGRRSLFLLLAGFGAASAHAVSFSNITVTGTAFGGFTNFGSNGLTFDLADNFLVGTGDKTVTITYRVDAATSMVLTGMTMSPVGLTKKGTVKIDAAHTNGGVENVNYLATGGSSVTALVSQSFTLSGTKNFYDVITTIKLHGNEPDSVNKATIYNLSYTEGAVPEPATMAALGLGVAAMLRRRRR